MVTINTAAATAAKTVEVTDYSLTAGAIIVATFAQGNSATNATLNITSTGAKAIKYNGSAVPPFMIKIGDTVSMIYDGTDWNIFVFDDYGDLDESYVNL